MQKRKTQHGNAGLQGDFNFQYTPYSLTAFTMQVALCCYRVDGQSNWNERFALRTPIDISAGADPAKQKALKVAA